LNADIVAHVSPPFHLHVTLPNTPHSAGSSPSAPSSGSEAHVKQVILAADVDASQTTCSKQANVSFTSLVLLDNCMPPWTSLETPLRANGSSLHLALGFSLMVTCSRA